MNENPMHFSVGIACFAPDSDFPIGSFEQELLLLCSAYKISACVFSPVLIDHTLASPLIPVQYWDGTAFRKAITPVPEILDCRFNPFLNKVVTWLQPERQRWLLKHSAVLDRGIPKEQLSQVLMCSPLYPLAIPTYRLTEYGELLRYAKLLRHCIIKPSGGRQGSCVARVDYDGDVLSMETADGIEELTPTLWDDYLTTLNHSNFGLPLLQPRLDFSLDAEHAVDFRLLVARGSSGLWEEVEIYARIGATRIVSNVSRGGYISDAESILSQIAGERADELLATLHSIAAELPVLIQQYVDRPISCLGIDIGIDRNTLQPYVLEANTLPGAKYHSWQLAHKRVQYYQYLLKNRQQ